MARLTPSEKLLKRLRNDLKLDIPVNCEIRRQYKGAHSDGAWKWFVYPPVGGLDIGSPYAVGFLLKRTIAYYKVGTDQIEITPF